MKIRAVLDGAKTDAFVRAVAERFVLGMTAAAKLRDRLRDEKAAARCDDANRPFDEIRSSVERRDRHDGFFGRLFCHALLLPRASSIRPCIRGDGTFG